MLNSMRVVGGRPLRSGFPAGAGRSAKQPSSQPQSSAEAPIEASSAFVPVAPKQDRDGQSGGHGQGQQSAGFAALSEWPALNGQGGMRSMAAKLGTLSRPQPAPSNTPGVVKQTGPDARVQWQRALGQALAVVGELRKPGRGGKEQLAAALPALLASLGGGDGRSNEPLEVSLATQFRLMSSLAEGMVGLARKNSGRLNTVARRVQGLLESVSQPPSAGRGPAKEGKVRPWNSAAVCEWFALHYFSTVKRMVPLEEGVYQRLGFGVGDSRDLPRPFPASHDFSQVAGRRMASPVRAADLQHALMRAQALVYENIGRKRMIWAFRSMETYMRSTAVKNMNDFPDLRRQFGNAQGRAVLDKGDRALWPPRVRFGLPASSAGMAASAA
jgi:hypothetical protein